MSDYIVRATAADSQIRAFAITSKEMVEEGRRSAYPSQYESDCDNGTGQTDDRRCNDGNNDERG